MSQKALDAKYYAHRALAGLIFAEGTAVKEKAIQALRNCTNDQIKRSLVAQRTLSDDPSVRFASGGASFGIGRFLCLLSGTLDIY